jgi:succinyl-diaminopimelate desuccinylase
MVSRQNAGREAGRQRLLAWIDADRDQLVRFLSRFVQARSPSPPGDTRKAAAHVARFLKSHGLKHRIVAPQKTMPNVVASFAGARPGRHLVFNGHLDVYPADESDSRWPHAPWAGTVAGGKLWGRGSVDMKCGLSALVWSYAYLHRLRKQLKGRLSLTAVSDEETFGVWGADYLLRRHPELRGDCCLSGEPSSPGAVRYGEKGVFWIEFAIVTDGADGGYTHRSPSASKLAMALARDLEAVTRIKPRLPAKLAAAIRRDAAAIDAAQGKGAAKVAERVTLNIGFIHSGAAINILPGEARLGADIRMPPGVEKAAILEVVHRVLARHPQAAMREVKFNPPSWSDPEGEMLRIIQGNARALGGEAPKPVFGVGGTDTRLWRYRKVPAYVYGPPPIGLGSHGEHVRVETFLRVVRTHALSAYDYLS